MGVEVGGSPSVPTGTPSLDSLFPVTRTDRPFGIRHIFLALWLPFGAALCAARLAWLMAFELVLFRIGDRLRMNNLFFTAYCWGLGVITVVKNPERLRGAKVVVSNHVSEVDGVACRAALGPNHSITPSWYGKFILSASLMHELHPIYIDVSDRDSLHLTISTTLKTSPYPILVFPEGCLTNGTALLAYYKHMFSLNVPVTPLAIVIKKPYFGVALDTLCCPTWHNLLWVLAMPFHIWTMNVLEPMTIEDGETAEQFAARVQRRTAQFLGVPTTPYFKTDKYRLSKERTHELRRRYRIKRIVLRVFDNIAHFRLPWK